MMKNYIQGLIFFTIATIILTGCSEKNEVDNQEDEVQVSENETQEDKNRDTIKNKPSEEGKIELEPLPSTYDELASRQMGEHHDFYFSLNEKEIQGMLETFSGLPDISTNPTEKELDFFYQELLSKVQEDFEGPERAIRELRFHAIGDPEIEDTRYQFKENLNVEIILDASGSMAGQVNGKVKMDAAKESILKFVKELPEGANIGLRVYGHKGTGSGADKALSCQSSEIMFPISTYDETSFQSALNQINPSGWTPIQLALDEARKDLEKFDGANNTNIVYLVSDGISTCDDHPVKAAEELFESNISPIINVIGFDVDDDGQKQLKEIASATEGIYTHVSDGNQLSEELAKINDLAKTWEKWKNQGTQSIELKKIDNNLDIFVYTTEEESKVSDERTRINLILSQLWQNNRMDKEAFQYLDEKNRVYHSWIMEEITKFKEELKALNEKNYTEALNTLENKYMQNTQ